MCALLKTGGEPHLLKNETLEAKYSRKKFRLADDGEVKWHGTKGESKNRMKMLSPPSLSVLCLMYGIDLPPKAFGMEQSQSLAVAAIVHLEATLAGAIRDEELLVLGKQYAPLEINELKIKCKKRRVLVNEASTKSGCVAALARDSSTLPTTPKKKKQFKKSFQMQMFINLQ